MNWIKYNWFKIALLIFLIIFSYFYITEMRAEAYSRCLISITSLESQNLDNYMINNNYGNLNSACLYNLSHKDLNFN